jgi:hypothetical protein
MVRRRLRHALRDFTVRLQRRPPVVSSFAATSVPGGLGQAVLGWSRDAAVRFDILPNDVSDFDVVQFRAAVNPGYFANHVVHVQDLSVVLEDGDGNRAEVNASDVGNDALA